MFCKTIRGNNNKGHEPYPIKEQVFIVVENNERVSSRSSKGITLNPKEEAISFIKVANVHKTETGKKKQCSDELRSLR